MFFVADRRLLLLRGGSGLGRPGACGPLLLARWCLAFFGWRCSATTAILAAAEQLESLNNDLMLAALAAALLVVPGFVFEAAFDQKRAAFLAVLIDHFRLLAEGATVDEADFLAILALRRAPFVIDGQADIDHGHLAGQISKLRIPRQIADQNHLVKVRHIARLSIANCKSRLD